MPRESLRHLLVPWIERRVVADEPEVLDRLLPSVLDLELELLRSSGRACAGLAERVSRRVDRLEGRLQLRSISPSLDQPAAHLVDDRTCSIPTGQISTHAMHCMHDQSVSGRIGSPRIELFES